MTVSKGSMTSISDVNQKQDGIRETKTISGEDIFSGSTVKRNESCDIEIANTDSSPDDSDAQSIAHSIGHQTNVLSTRQLLIAFPALSLALFVSFIDQTSVSTSIPSISSDLNAGSSTSWVGGSFLIASTAFQLINGRLSDIFGRKSCLLVCLGLLAFGDLLCGFAKSATMLFVFRALAGVGAGGVNSIAMIIVSDVTTLQNRGYYQGILGAVIAMANGIGPFVGGVLVEKASWRWVFWIVPPLTVPAMVVILLFLPLKHQHEGAMDKIRKIDFAGVALNIAAVLLILIPLSGAGTTYAWDSAFFIAMITVGGLLAIIFILYEWKFAKIPIMPLHILNNLSCSVLYFLSFFMGLVFYGNFFYLPIYFQSVLEYNALISGALLLPLIIATSVMSVISGQIMARTGSYKICVVVGFGLWTVGAGLKCKFDRNTNIGMIIGSLIMEGLGTGWTLQPTLVAILANSANQDRAVSTGLRNFLRTVGGAFGLVISGAILNNTLHSRLSSESFITHSLLATLSSSTYGINNLGLSSAEKDIILDVYMAGLKYIYILYVCSVGLNFCLSGFVKNTSLRAPKTTQEVEGVEAPREEPRGHEK